MSLQGLGLINATYGTDFRRGDHVEIDDTHAHVVRSVGSGALLLAFGEKSASRSTFSVLVQAIDRNHSQEEREGTE